MLVSKQNQTVTVNVSEEVILNCTVSASPDLVYSWSFPDSCSSCPNTSNDSVLIFTAKDITDSGEYTCVAENEYRIISIRFSVHVISKYSNIILCKHHNITEYIIILLNIYCCTVMYVLLDNISVSKYRPR